MVYCKELCNSHNPYTVKYSFMLDKKMYANLKPKCSKPLTWLGGTDCRPPEGTVPGGLSELSSADHASKLPSSFPREQTRYRLAVFYNAALPSDDM